MRSLGNVGATIVMPKFTPATKVTRTAAWGAHVVLHGETLAEAAAHARALAAERHLVFVHPYDDLGVMAARARWRWNCCRTCRIWMRW